MILYLRFLPLSHCNTAWWRNTKHLTDMLPNGGLILTIIASYLCRFSAPSSLPEMTKCMDNRERNFDELKKHYFIILDTCEPALVLDKNQIFAWGQLAFAKLLLGKHEEALSFAKHGMENLKILKDKNISFHLSKSKLDIISNGADDLDQMEEMLNVVIE